MTYGVSGSRSNNLLEVSAASTISLRGGPCNEHTDHKELNKLSNWKAIFIVQYQTNKNLDFGSESLSSRISTGYFSLLNICTHKAAKNLHISVLLALSRRPAKAARPRIVHRVVCPFTPQLSLVLINRPRIDGTLSWRWYPAATGGIWTHDLAIASPALYHSATCALEK